MKKSNLITFVKLWLPPLLWAIVIFILSSIPQIKVSQFLIWDFIAKKTAHLIEYAVLFALIFRASQGKWVKSFFLTMIYAASDEYHQSFVPGRTSSIFDLGFDLSGASIASYICHILSKHTTVRKN